MVYNTYIDTEACILLVTSSWCKRHVHKFYFSVVSGIKHTNIDHQLLIFSHLSFVLVENMPKP